MASKLQNNKSYYKDFYKSLDGHYNSYWVGKFINAFVKHGQKHVVEKALVKTYTLSKISLNTISLHTLLLTFDKIKPTFKLKYVTVAGKKKDFPVLLPLEKRHNRAVRNIKNSVENRKEWYLNQRILAELASLKTASNHELFKERDAAFSEAIKNRFNTRYNR